MGIDFFVILNNKEKYYILILGKSSDKLIGVIVQVKPSLIYYQKTSPNLIILQILSTKS